MIVLKRFEQASYYYDAETELYYLQSRYYDAGVGRFVNGDDAEYLAFVYKSGTEYNVSSYCANEPVTNLDFLGFKKISVTWIEPTVNVICVLIPVIWSITKLLKSGKAVVKTLIELGKHLVKKGKKIIKKIDDWLYCQFSTTLGYELAKILGAGLISLIAVFSSVGGIIQYVIDCLDGKWDDKLDTNKKLKLRVILKRSK